MIVQVPLFLFNNQKAAAAQATAIELAARSQYRQTQVQVLTDVEKAY